MFMFSREAYKKVTVALFYSIILTPNNREILKFRRFYQ